MRGDFSRARSITLPAHEADGLTASPKDSKLEKSLFRIKYCESRIKIQGRIPPRIEPGTFCRYSRALTTRPSKQQGVPK